MQLKNVLEERSNEIKTRIAETETTVEALDRKLIELELQQKNTFARADFETVNSDPELSKFLQKGVMPADMERKDISVTSDGQGVSVRSRWSDRIFKEIRETSPMRQVASVMTTASDSLEVLVDRGEPLSNWIGELDPRAETDTSFLTRHKIAVHEHYANPQVTLQMLEDSSFNVEAWLQSKLASRFTRQEEASFFLGDGVGQPRGILTYGAVEDSLFTWGADPDNYTIGSVYTGVAGDVTNPDDLIDLVDSLKAAYLPGASWLMTRAMKSKIRKLKDLQERYLFEPALTAGAPDRLLGYPVFIAEDMPALADGVVGALFGNFSEAYTIVDRLGVTVQRDSFTQPGWVKYYARKRLGGALTNPEAVKALVLGTAPT
ncbi:MAG: phage major capsid protein [Methyloprofundus sp.]|nr:phage major capsid protein [Methyloprofundus sp.]